MSKIFDSERGFLRWTILAWVFIIAIIWIYYYAYQRPNIHNFVLKRAQSNSEKLAVHLINQAGYTGEMPLDTLIARLPALLKHETIFIIWKVRLFDSNSNILFSTESSEIGTRKESLTAAMPGLLSGNVHSKIVEKGARSSCSEIVAQSVVETYVPLILDSDYKGTFEIYLNADSWMEEAEEFMRESRYYMFLLTGVLFVILIFAFLKIYTQRKYEKDSRKLLTNIVRIIAVSGGRDLYHNITEFLCEHLQASCCMVGLKDTGMIKTESFFYNGALQENIQFNYTGAPAEDVLKNKNCWFESGVIEKYPNNKDLIDFGAQVYIGVPILQNDGDPIGVLNVVSKKKLKLPEYTRNMMIILADRIALEIERDETHDTLLLQQEQAARAKRLSTLGDMAGGMAHEFNQPLCAIRAFVENLQIGIERKWDVGEKEYLDKFGKIIILTEKMASLIQHVRDFSQSAGNEHQVPVELHKVVEAALSITASQLQGHGIQVAFETGSTAIVQANPFAVEEFVLELIHNSRDAFNLEATEKEKKISMRIIDTVTDDGREYTELIVSDNGIGMKKEILERIFDPFFTNKEVGQGQGLGLSSIRNGMHSFNGEVYIDSEYGKGTSCILRFPKSVSEQYE